MIKPYKGIPNINRMIIHRRVSFVAINLTSKRSCEICRKPIQDGRAWQRLRMILTFHAETGKPKFHWDKVAHRCFVHAPKKELIYPLSGSTQDDVQSPSNRSSSERGGGGSIPHW